MTTNIDRATDLMAEALWDDNGNPRGTITEAVRALADEGYLMPAPQIIRTAEELEALDNEDFLMTLDGNIYYAIGAKGRLFPGDLPAVVVATGEQVRAARKALEKET